MMGAVSGVAAANGLCATSARLFGVDGVAVSMIDAGASRGTFGSSSEAGRRLDEYQFTFGEGPCLDAAASRKAVLVPDLASPHEQRWPIFTEAVVGDGIRGVFAIPIMVASVCVGALDLFRGGAGPLSDEHLAGALVAAELAALPLLDLLSQARDGAEQLDARLVSQGEDAWGMLADMDRIEVYQATGILISQLDVDATEALIRLRARAISSGQTASQVACAIIEGRLDLERDG